METDSQLQDEYPVQSDSGYQFTDLSDDDLREIFKYFDSTERTILEVVCRRFGDILPPLCYRVDHEEFPHLCQDGYEETETFFHLVRKSPALWHVDFGLIYHDALLSMLLDGSRTVDDFVDILNVTVESLALHVSDERLSNVHFAAECARRLGSDCGIKYLNITFALYQVRIMNIAIRKFTDLVQACGKLEKLEIVVQDSDPDDSVPSTVYHNVREEADNMWRAIANQIKELKLKYYDAPYPKFGNVHYTGHSWTNLTKVTISNELSPAYLKRLVNNAPKLEWVSFIVEDLTCLRTISKLNHLKSLKLKYFEISESDSVRRKNYKTFLDFLIRRGRQLKEIFLTLPYQDNCFSDPVIKYCDKHLVTKLRYRGSPKRTLDVDRLIKLPNIRRLQLDAALSAEKIRVILGSCSKLKRFHFVIPAFERTSVEGLKQDILNYSANHPKRLITARIEVCGLTYQGCDESQIGNCVLKVIDGYW
ncbi:hypothetical protein HDE_01147 [Halotydeus destructor]|nr:hypothetical protein HDE_01147 [Halotydeus destructor]